MTIPKDDVARNRMCFLRSRVRQLFKIWLKFLHRMNYITNGYISGNYEIDIFKIGGTMAHFVNIPQQRW